MISTKITTSPDGMWWSARSSSSFSSYSRLSRRPGSLATSRIVDSGSSSWASRTIRRAVLSRCTAVIRSSVLRSAREANDTMKIAATKTRPILRPSGRSIMFATVV